LAGLSKAVAAFVIATIHFFFAAGLSGDDHSIFSPEEETSTTEGEAPTAGA
jgi:hypothetical protein